jgi:hypothetical protein
MADLLNAGQYEWIGEDLRPHFNFVLLDLARDVLTTKPDILVEISGISNQSTFQVEAGFGPPNPVNGAVAYVSAVASCRITLSAADLQAAPQFLCKSELRQSAVTRKQAHDAVLGTGPSISFELNEVSQARQRLDLWADKTADYLRSSAHLVSDTLTKMESNSQ